MRVYNEGEEVDKWWEANNREEPNSCADLCLECFEKWEGCRWDEPPSAWSSKSSTESYQYLGRRGLLLDGHGEPIGVIDGRNKHDHLPYVDEDCDSCGKQLTEND